ncbi:hypothetical protein OEA41_001216 [Lepraria neglecta]|uniref:Uncharacterized protein n=1 Tax=Lepraria neglecta TaxID=209136 RepID=A0AAD9ZJR5_9LECA|nr:hypothetical protein OEA41_001216 [Lepraria neglecta]
MGSVVEGSSPLLPPTERHDDPHNHPRAPMSMPEFIDEQFAIEANDELAQPDCSMDSDTEETISSPRQRQSEIDERTRSEIRRLKGEQEQLDFAIQKHQAAIQKHQSKKADLQVTIEAWLGSETKGAPIQPSFTTMETIHESTLPMSERSGYHGVRDSKSPSGSGKTTLVEHEDELGLGDPMEFTSHDLDAPNPVVIIQPEMVSGAAPASQSREPSISKRSSKHLDVTTPPKRKRASLSLGRKSNAPPILHQDQDPVDQGEKLDAEDLDPIPIYHTLNTSRVLQMNRGKDHAGTQSKPTTPQDIGEGLVVINSARPASYPLARRWRRSLGVSVKTITERFECLSVIARPTPVS